MLFTGQAVKYSANYAFQAKVALMALAASTCWCSSSNDHSRRIQWNRAPRVPVAAKLGRDFADMLIAVVAYGDGRRL